MPPGSAMPSRRAATFTPSPSRSSPFTITSPRLMPMRNASRFSSGSDSLRVFNAAWISTAQRNASTGLANSASTESPAVPTMRPLWKSMMPSITARCAERMRMVSSSSRAMCRL